MCVDSSLEFLIELIDEKNRTSTRVHRNLSTEITLNDLNSFTIYTVIVSAKNKLGISPKSLPLVIQTLESGNDGSIVSEEKMFFSAVPLALVGDLTATQLNMSTVHLGWTMDRDRLPALHGRFRTFALTFYQNYSK